MSIEHNQNQAFVEKITKFCNNHRNKLLHWDTDHQVFATTSDLNSSPKGPRGSVADTFLVSLMLPPETGVEFWTLVFLGVMAFFFMWWAVAFLFFFFLRPPHVSVQKARCFLAYLLPDLHLLQSPFTFPFVAPSEH